MAFQRFCDIFPDLGIAETRDITLIQAEYGLPAGSYGFIEQFCNDSHCDCRRVIFSVYMKGREEPIAAIGWGWESREFYANWMKWEADPAEIDRCKGPELNPLSPQSEWAEGALRLCRDVLIQDPAYVERVKGHYRLFRERIDRGYVPQGLSQAARERKKKQVSAAAKKAQKAARKRNRR